MKAASSAALPSPPSGWTKSLSPRGGSPRSAKTFSIPAASIRSSVAARPSAVSPTQLRWAIISRPRSSLERAGDLDRAFAGRAAGAVGDRDEVGLQLAAARGPSRRAARRASSRLRREELDREARAPGGEDLVDSHRASVASASWYGFRRRMRQRRWRAFGCCARFASATGRERKAAKAKRRTYLDRRRGELISSEGYARGRHTADAPGRFLRPRPVRPGRPLAWPGQ